MPSGFITEFNLISIKFLHLAKACTIIQPNSMPSNGRIVISGDR
jgi:hypothetical protein